MIGERLTSANPLVDMSLKLLILNLKSEPMVETTLRHPSIFNHLINHLFVRN